MASGVSGVRQRLFPMEARRKSHIGRQAVFVECLGIVCSWLIV
jgi:hypothetical protein